MEKNQKPAADYLNKLIKSREFEKKVQNLRKGLKFWIKIILISLLMTVVVEKCTLKKPKANFAKEYSEKK